MKKRLKILFYILAFSFIEKPVIATSGLWSTNDVRLPIVKNNISYRVLNRTYLNDKSLGIDSMLLRTGPIFNLTDNFSLGLNATLVGFNKGENKFMQEIRYEIEPSFDFSFDKMKLNDRNRFELRFLHDISFRYRNSLSISYKIDFPINPYISDEIFISSNELPSNRFILGLLYPVNKQLKVSLAYMHMSSMQKDQTWNNSPTLLVSLLSDFSK